LFLFVLDECYKQTLFYVAKFSRFQSILGTDIECIYTLMTFGINKEAIPVNGDGTVDLTRHHSMLEVLKCREAKSQKEDDKQATDKSSVSPNSSSTATTTSSDDTVLVLPGNMDIILGRGKHTNNNSVGSLRMHSLLQENHGNYEEAAKFDKTIIADIILRKLELCGCRFLKVTPYGFQICDVSVAREKISHTFRNMRRTQLCKANKTKNASLKRERTSKLSDQH
jgi:hypothetical protein